MTLPSDPDAQLMLAFQAGDEAVFETLYERHHRTVLNVAYRLLGDSNTAEDVAQEVFVKLYTSPRSYRPSAKFSTWLYRVAYNASIDEIRKRKSRPSELTDSEIGQFPGLAMEADELTRAVRDAIASLPEKQRAAVVLQRYEGLSYQEIADVLKTSVAAVESLLFRARESLKATLATYAKADE